MPFNAQRNDLENVVNNHKKVLEKINLLLINSEGGHSKKRRRFSKGVDDLESVTTSDLREQWRITSAACIDGEAELKSFICDKQEVLQTMFRELRELDKAKYEAIHDVLCQYIRDTSPQSELICNEPEKYTYVD